MCSLSKSNPYYKGRQFKMIFFFFQNYATFLTWTMYRLFTLSQTTNVDSSKPKEFADNKLKFDNRGRKFFKRVENTVGKGEIALYKQLLFFSIVFSKDLFC